MSTFCRYMTQNVDMRGRSAEMSTFCTLPPGSLSMQAVRPRLRHRLTAALPQPTMTLMPGTATIAATSAIVAACSIIAIAT